MMAFPLCLESTFCSAALVPDVAQRRMRGCEHDRSAACAARTATVQIPTTTASARQRGLPETMARMTGTATDPTQFVNRRDSAGHIVAPDPVAVDDRPFGEENKRYDVIGTVAQGGMGEILLAKDT